MKTNVGVIILGLLAAQFGSPAQAIPVPSGVEPAPEDTTYDAICGIGIRKRLTGPDAKDWFDGNGMFDPLQNGGVSGSGTLIAPDLVLTVRHLFPTEQKICIESLDDYFCPTCSPSSSRRWVARFRRNPDGTVGTMGEFPVPPHDVRGPESFHHVEIVGAIEVGTFGNCPDSVILILAEPVTHIQPLLMAEVDPRPFPTVGLNDPDGVPGGTTHGADVVHDLTYAGWGSSTPGSTPHGSGQLRFRTGGLGTFPTSSPLFSRAIGDAPVDLHDSGSPVLVSTGADTLAILRTVSSVSEHGMHQGWKVGGRESGFWITDPRLTGVITAAEWFDVTTSPVPLEPGYGQSDGRVDLADVLYTAAETTLGNLAVDFTGSADPNDPDYGVPDGVADGTDFAFYVVELLARSESHVGPWPPLPLTARGADTDGDGRFTANDFEAPGLSAGQLSRFDFDRDGVITPSETTLVAGILQEFGHGLLADLNGDGVTDYSDFDEIIALLQITDPWSGQTHGEPAYRVSLDANLDGFNTLFDRRDIAALFLPGEVADAAHLTSIEKDALGAEPDFAVTRMDRFAAFWELHDDVPRCHMLDTTGSGDPASPAWGRPDQVVDDADLKHFLWRQYEVFGPGGPLADPDVTRRMWPAFDANGSGRLTYDDFLYLEALDPLSPEALLWDLDGDGVFTPYGSGTPGSDTVPLVTAMFGLGWNQGVLGDFDGDASPTSCCTTGSVVVCLPPLCIPAVDVVADCDDYWAIWEQVWCLNNNLFNGRSFFADTDEGYLPVLDADLDGANDLYDQCQVLLVGIGAADLNLDGLLNQADFDFYMELFNEGNLAVDLASPLGELTIADVQAYLGLYTDNACDIPASVPLPCP